MESLAKIVQQELTWYTSGGEDLEPYLMQNPEKQVYAVVVVDTDPPQNYVHSDMVVMARVVGDYVVIEDDRTDKPFKERLMAAGIPREKIILAYAGEKVPANP